jgi:GntR family transcriptional regulator/MocR family aminotransferase
VVARAAELGVAVEGVAPMRVRHPGPPAFVVGYARLPERRLAEAVDLLAVAGRRVTRRTLGRHGPIM